jgi:hypothetical protein
VEERRPLQPAENRLRSVVVRLLSKATHAKLTFWKQRSKIRAAIEGDENTRYFHVCVNQRRRRNKIQVIEHDGQEHYSHEQKANILHVFYHNLVGCVRDTSWGFSLDNLYPDGPLQLEQLDFPFTDSENYGAIRRMHS